MCKPSYLRGLGLSFVTAFVLIISGLSLQAVDADNTGAAIYVQDDLDSLVDGNTAFAFDLYQQLADYEAGNLIFSPYSISLAFAMLYAGATGEAAMEMAETFHYRLPPAQLHSAFNALDMILQPPKAEVPTPTPTISPFGENPADELVLTISNSIWGQEGFPLEETYLETLARYYGAGVIRVDFVGDDEGSHQAIRQWVEQATQGHIKNMPPRNAISSATRLALVNAIYFRGEWTYPFRETNTYDGVFHTIDNREISVPMMVNNFAYLQCVRTDDYHAVQLNYGRAARAGILILLPDVGMFYDVEDRLDAELFRETLAALEITNMLDFTMPRFAFESEINLIDTLSAMGMTAPFTKVRGFEGISSEELLINYAGHKATISVDEQGTEASGTTSIAMALSGVLSPCGDDVLADRPFVFIIFDRQTHTILFLGRLMNPAN